MDTQQNSSRTWDRQQVNRRNLCFVANYTKTDFFDSVAERLEEQGYRVYWICVNVNLNKMLRSRYGNSRVLYLDKAYVDKQSPALGSFKLHELVYGDRALRHIPVEGLKYLTNIQRPVYEFLKNNDIHFCFGELTWAHEVLIKRITQQKTELDCEYLGPHTVRIPTGRFGFFSDEFQTRLLERKNVSDSERIPEASVEIERPDYMRKQQVDRRPHGFIRSLVPKIKRFVTEENIDKSDPTHIGDRWTRLKIRASEVINKEMFRFVKSISIDEIGDKKYVFVALHVQPESSIDVTGRYYEDQYQNVVNIWRSVPDDWLTIVKEHVCAIGNRPISFYRQLQRLPNLHFVDCTADSHELIKNSELVATVSGTVAYEAALLGKRAITLVPMFFNEAASCRHITLDDLRNTEHLGEIIGTSREKSVDVRAYVEKNSYPGIISDPLADDRCMAPENVELVALAFAEIVGSTKERKVAERA